MNIDLDPNLITIGPFVLSWHGLFSAVGLAAGIWIAARLLRGTIVPEDDVMTTADAPNRRPSSVSMPVTRPEASSMMRRATVP